MTAWRRGTTLSGYSEVGKTTLWDVYCFAYHLALKSFGGGVRSRDLLRLLIEPCTYWRNVEVPEVLSRLSVRPGDKVLDVGSPKLPSLYIWRKLGAEVWATDLFPYFVEEYRRFSQRLRIPSSSPAYHVELQDARDLRYRDGFFDRVYSISVVEHIEGDGDTAALREFARVLRPGGLCCLTFPIASRYREECTSAALYYKRSKHGEPVFYQRHYDEEALQGRLVGPSGLEVLATEQYGERWVGYEELYRRLPRFVKVPASVLGPAFSKLFLYRMRGASLSEPKTGLLLLRKALSPLGDGS